MNIYTLNSTLEEAQEEIGSLGLEPLFSIEEAGIHKFAFMGPKYTFKTLCYEKTTPAEIDWEAQFEAFGSPQVDLGPHGKIELIPGPGFGDFSHPTTRLMLDLMSSHVQNHTILDVGCGSGILSIAAAKMGAKMVYGYDICPQAIKHAQKNAKNNLLEIPFSLEPPKAPFYDEKPIVLINMLLHEQELALKAIAEHLPKCLKVLVSGLLSGEKASFLSDYYIEEQAELDGWHALTLSN